MQGGLFDLTPVQTTYLYAAQITPVVVTYVALNHYNDLLPVSIIVQLLYVCTSFAYIRLLSKEQELAPYRMNDSKSVRVQCQKGLSLAVSAFLLLTFYSILIIKLGRVVLPKHLDFGQHSHQWWPVFLLLCLINPVLEEWYWRLFLPKSIKLTFAKGLFLNICYLLFHFVLFSHFLGFWRSIPLVGTFNSVGRSMTHIQNKFGIVCAIITHYGITLAGAVISVYVRSVLHG